MEPLYFGCWRQAGHYLFRRGMKSGYGAGPTFAGPDGWQLDVPNPRKGRPSYQPLEVHTAQIEGHAKLSHVELYTVLGFWDRSVDKRHASHSTFVLPGLLSFSEAIAAARAAFPEVFARISFELVLVETAGLTSEESRR